MNLDLRHVPFSRAGSFLAISYLKPPGESREGLYLRTVHGGVPRTEILRLEPVAGGVPAAFAAEAGATLLRLLPESGGSIEICLPEPGKVRLRGQGAGLRLTLIPGAYANAVPRAGQSYEINGYEQRIKLMLTPLCGEMRLDAPWEVDRCLRVIADLLPGGDGRWECMLEECLSDRVGGVYAQDFADDLAAVEGEYGSFLAMTPEVPAEYAAGRELAAYITWSCLSGPSGALARPAMYMSKNWMTSVWSWDHCFNAMALARRDPALAWDQFMLPFDRQDESGALPDSWNDQEAVWNFCKPPVHGWTLAWMRRRTDQIGTDRLAEIYMPLRRWTEWWFASRDDDHDGFPQYNHGNDSGWDNATVFHAGVPVEGPDLAAFLVLQMEELAEIARALGKDREESEWRTRARELLERMLDHFWRGGRFVAPRSGSHAVFEEGDSLFNFLPVVLGRRLPAEVLRLLVEGLKEEGRFLTAHGLATESQRSPLYEPDGYWRGPIWAPSTMLIVDGLRQAGEDEFARELARRFCAMAAHSGMAENYDALTGAGLRDRAYTWTASVFLILASEYL